VSRPVSITFRLSTKRDIRLPEHEGDPVFRVVVTGTKTPVVEKLSADRLGAPQWEIIGLGGIDPAAIVATALVRAFPPSPPRAFAEVTISDALTVIDLGRIDPKKTEG
jgi:hypothetical protein